MKNPTLTVVLLVMIVLAMAWTNGRLQRVLGAAFGGSK